MGRRPGILRMGDLAGPSSGPDVVAKKRMRACTGFGTAAFKLFCLFTVFITELPIVSVKSFMDTF